LVSGARLDDDGARGPAATVFVSDPTAEAERVAQALRAASYTVVDVPLSMLVARVAVQHPRVILVDADAEGALEVIARMRELPDADDIHVLFLARPGGAVASPEESLAHEGSGLFVRPVDVSALVRKVGALTGGAPDIYADPVRTSTPPPSVLSAQARSPSSPPSLPPVGVRSPVFTVAASEPGPVSLRASKLPSEPPASAGSSSRRPLGPAPPVSPELQKLLAEAEQRVQVQGPASILPSPEDEIEAVLPAELLASLDEPLEEDDDDDESMAPAKTPAPREAPQAHGITGAGPVTPVPTHTPLGTQAGSTGAGTSTTGASDRRERSDASSRGEPTPLPSTSFNGELASTGLDAGAGSPPARRGEDESSTPAVVGPGDAIRVVARAIAARKTSSMCLAAADAERRVVLRDGDVVTTSSTAEEESLLAFLGVRGDLPRDTVRRLGPSFPPFGRHAGAALVARGYLRQDQMWPTLRAHAEWVLARTLQTSSARLVVEAQPPGRLAAEPSVFGGSTGAEVFVEAVRRIVSPPEAIERMGGLGSRFGEGPEMRLLAECALDAAETNRVRGATGRSLREVLEASPEGELATILFALSQLGVVEVFRAVRDGPADAAERSAADATIDADAIRERVRARLQLVEDGDYFAVLGVTPEATGYEVRRAFLELRRAFDPSRTLTPEVADLAEDVRKITVVLEEAYEILKDSARRERYRRAIEGAPGR